MLVPFSCFSLSVVRLTEFNRALMYEANYGTVHMV